MARHISITAGPSREALFDALRLNMEGRTVNVSWRDSNEVLHFTKLRIMSIGLEDGSGESWYGDAIMDGKRVKYYLNTANRSGTLNSTD